jgi:hypothetical protein
MDSSEIKAPLQAEPNHLQAQCDALRQTLNSLMVLLFLVSGTLTIYLVRQWRFTQRDLEAFRPQATQFISEYAKGAPTMQEFVNKLAEYGKTHPDFAPIVAKYRLNDIAGKAGSNVPPVSSSQK